MERRKGFTLVELLCVLVILSILILLVGRLAVKNVNDTKKEVSEAREKAILNAAEKWSVNNSNAFDDIDESISAEADVVFLIDISGSMGSVNGTPAKKTQFVSGSTVPIIQTVEAINSAVETVLETSPNSRIGLVVYGTTAAILLPLDHYSITDTPFLQVSYNDNQGGYEKQGVHFLLTVTAQNADTHQVLSYYADNAGSTNNQTHGISGTGNRAIQGTGGKTEGDGTKSSPYRVGHITNPQAGLAVAMEQLIGAKDVTWQSKSGTTHYRIPTLIHLTDGQATDIAYISDPLVAGGKDWEKELSNWYHVNWKYDLAYNSIVTTGKNQYNASQLNAESSVPAIVFQTLMTASYYKSAVENHYHDTELLSYSIYANDNTPYELLSGSIKATVGGILNPTVLLKANPTDEEGDSIYQTAIKGAYELVKKWESGEKITQEISSTNYVTIKLNANQSQISGNSYGVTVNDVIKNINYIPEGNFYTSGFADLSKVFNTIVTEVADSTKITEVCVSIEDLYKEGYLKRKDADFSTDEEVKYVIIGYNEAVNQYAFSLAKTDKQKKTCQQSNSKEE